MIWSGATAPQTDDTRLLEQAISYALGTVDTMTPQLLSRPTPCRGWDLRMLLRHASESLAAPAWG
jgi:hypothetical protein